MTSVLIILSVTVLLANFVDGFIDNFNMYGNFNDNRKIERNLILDISSAETFVLEANAFCKHGHNLTFDPTNSPTFEKKDPFTITYSNLTNDEEYTVSGYRGEDTLRVNNFLVKAPFSVATKVEGDVLKSHGKDRYAGRAGFSRGRSELREKYHERTRTTMLCFFLRVFNEESKLAFKTVTWYHFYNSTLLKVNVSSEPNANDLWQVPLTSLDIGRFSSKFTISAILSTTLSGITVPERYLNPIVRTLGGKWNAEKKYYNIPCGKQIPLTIGINGTKVDVDYDGYVETVDFKKKECRLRLRSHKEDLFVLGLPLFVNQGACFDFYTDTVALFRVF